MRKESRIDLFRYGIISPLVYGEAKEMSKTDFFKEASKKTYYFEGKEYTFSSETIKKWYYKYNNLGFDKLKNKERNDKNKSRKLGEEAINYIRKLKGEYPKITTKKIYERLLEEKIINDNIDIRSFYRYIDGNNLTSVIINSKERRRFEVENVNDCWQADTTYGPYIVAKDGKKYRTFLIHFIDDKSRLITGYGFFYNDNAENVQKVLKKAISKYGIPKMIYLDNGKSYKNIQMEIICARLGIKVVHTHAYDPEAKGKVERCFRTIKEGWMYTKDWNKYKDIEELEEDYKEYLLKEYINKEHSELKETPNNVWHEGIKQTKYKQVDKNKLDEIFMHTETRKVNKDRTINLNNKVYEAPYKYIGQKVEIRYVAGKQEEIWIYEKDERKEKCNLLNKEENSRVKRTTNIDYSKIINKEEDVVEKEE